MNNPTIRKKTFDSISQLTLNTTRDISELVDDFIREDEVWYICADLVKYKVQDCVKDSVKRAIVRECIQELLNE